ncbi:MAG: hypothetical protein WAQ05_21285 [Rubrivivax sp.]
MKTPRITTTAAPWGAAFFCLALGAQAAVDDAALLRCRAIADNAARLACYDTLTPAPAASIPATAAPVAAAPVAPPSAAPGANSFGFELRALQAAPEVLESRISGVFEGWERGTRIRLDNGQVWQVIDDSRAVVNQRDAKVKISRAAMGSFLFEVEGRRSAARVRRVE